MSRMGLVIWLLMPVVIVAALWTIMDRSRGKPDRMFMHAGGVRPVQPGAKVQPESLAQGFILVVDDKVGKADESSPIYLASSHNGWNPADPKQRLTRRSDGRWQIVLPKPALDSRLAFKFTRGSWDNEELRQDGSTPDNKMLPLLDEAAIKPGEPPVIEFVVHKWKEQNPATPAAQGLNPYRQIRLAGGTLHRLQVVGGADPAMVREALVWLPPKYDAPVNKDRRYPVLYVQDGDQAFEQLPGLPGEWGMDEALVNGIGAGKVEPIIVVAIPNAGAGRTNEYLPLAAMDGAEPKGDRYVDFLIHEVKPRVERAFRVKPGAVNTGVGGFSLGAIIALHAATEHPEVFGKVLAESPPLAMNEPMAMRFFGIKAKWPFRVYVGIGTKEAGTDPKDAETNVKYVDAVMAFAALLSNKGLNEGRSKVVVDPEGVHNEPSWARRLPAALEYLFPAREPSRPEDAR